MKVFIAACLALLICICTVTATAIVTDKTFDTIAKILERLPDTLSENEKAPDSIIRRLDEAYKKWISKEFVLNIGISKRETDDFEMSLKNLMAATEAGDPGYYAVCLATVRDKLENLTESEKLSIEGII